MCNGQHTTHGTLYPYDQRVPVIFFGAGVAKGIHDGPASPADIAPTLGALVGARLEPADGWPGAVILAVTNPEGAFAMCRALRKGDIPLEPVLLIASAEQLPQLDIVGGIDRTLISQEDSQRFARARQSRIGGFDLRLVGCHLLRGPDIVDPVADAADEPRMRIVVVSFGRRKGALVDVHHASLGNHCQVCARHRDRHLAAHVLGDRATSS